MKATIPIALQAGTKLLRIEREADDDIAPYERHWRIWINANYDFTLGTQIVLKSDGSIDNVTQNEDGTETVFEVKGPDT